MTTYNLYLSQRKDYFITRVVTTSKKQQQKNIISALQNQDKIYSDIS